MGFERLSYDRTNIRLQPPQIFDCFRREDDIERHSG
jgi:hypothetical protein